MAKDNKVMNDDYFTCIPEGVELDVPGCSIFIKSLQDDSSFSIIDISDPSDFTSIKAFLKFRKRHICLFEIIRKRKIFELLRAISQDKPSPCSALRLFDDGYYIDCFFYVFNKSYLHIDFFECGAEAGFANFSLVSCRCLCYRS